MTHSRATVSRPYCPHFVNRTNQGSLYLVIVQAHGIEWDKEHFLDIMEIIYCEHKESSTNVDALHSDRANYKLSYLNISTISGHFHLDSELNLWVAKEVSILLTDTTYKRANCTKDLDLFTYVNSTVEWVNFGLCQLDQSQSAATVSR